MRYILMMGLIWSLSTVVHAEQILENFDAYAKGRINFSGWYVRQKKGDPYEVYSIAKEGDNKYVHAENKGQYAQVFRKVSWKIKKNPYLNWKWRVVQHPVGADPNKNPNDVAAAVYVVFKKSLFSVRTIKYAWGVKGETEYIRGKKSNYPQILVRNDPANKDKWVLEKRNVLEDYKKVFGGKIKNPVAFGILTEADQVKKKHAVADYDDFFVSSK